MTSQEKILEIEKLKHEVAVENCPYDIGDFIVSQKNNFIGIVKVILFVEEKPHWQLQVKKVYKNKEDNKWHISSSKVADLCSADDVAYKIEEDLK